MKAIGIDVRTQLHQEFYDRVPAVAGREVQWSSSTSRRTDIHSRSSFNEPLDVIDTPFRCCQMEWTGTNVEIDLGVADRRQGQDSETTNKIGIELDTGHHEYPLGKTNRMPIPRFRKTSIGECTRQRWRQLRVASGLSINNSRMSVSGCGEDLTNRAFAEGQIDGLKSDLAYWLVERRVDVQAQLDLYS